MKVTVYTVSLGCPKNLVDTEKALGQLGSALQPAERLEEADLVLINTCSFIQPAVEESVQTILETAVDINSFTPKPPLLVTGCLPARYGLEVMQELPEVDLWISFAEQEDWPGKLLGWLAGRPQYNGLRTRLEDARKARGAARPARARSTPPSYAYLKISEGCRHACRFCLIPSIRGPLRSEPQAGIVEEAKALLSGGVRELCLVAQDVTAYGLDLGDGPALPGLLDSLAGLPGLTWLRLLYLYPSGLSAELLRQLKDISPPFLPYFDVPLQHAHPDILRRMGRPFAGNPWRTVERIRGFFPEASLRTSLMVGYPGETAAHFEALKDFVRRAGFSHLGVFAYSAEEGTPAAALPDQVDAELAEARREELMALQAEVSAEQLAGCRGRELEVLVDRPDPEWPTLYQGRAWFQAPEIDGITYVSGFGLRPGDLVRTRVEESWSYDLSALAESAAGESPP